MSTEWHFREYAKTERYKLIIRRIGKITQSQKFNNKQPKSHENIARSTYINDRFLYVIKKG